MTTTSSQPTGFAGLSLLLSDRPMELALAATNASNALPKPSLPTSEPVPVASIPGYGHSSRAWVILIILAVLFIGFFVTLANNNQQSSYTPSTKRSTDAPSTYRPSTDAPSTYKPSTYTQPIVQEKMPSVGRALVLDEAEIRYCLSQKIRLEGAESVVNSYVKYEVDRFNALIDNYNSRCSEFRYQTSVMGRIRPEVESRRATLYAEGRGLLK